MPDITINRDVYGLVEVAIGIFILESVRCNIVGYILIGEIYFLTCRKWKINKKNINTLQEECIFTFSLQNLVTLNNTFSCVIHEV